MKLIRCADQVQQTELGRSGARPVAQRGEGNPESMNAGGGHGFRVPSAASRLQAPEMTTPYDSNLEIARLQGFPAMLKHFATLSWPGLSRPSTSSLLGKAVRRGCHWNSGVPEFQSGKKLRKSETPYCVRSRGG